MNYTQARHQHPGVTELLDRLQSVYSEKNIPRAKHPPTAAKEVAERLFGSKESSLVIGTEIGEWFSGHDEIAGLLYWDLAEWGSVDFLFPNNSVISVLKDSGWVATRGICSMMIEPDELWSLLLNSILKQIASSMLSAERKAAEINKYKAQISAEILHGPNYCWPFRFTAVFENTFQGWRFGYMHFSLPSGLMPWFRTDSILPYPDKANHPFFRPIPNKGKQ
jgi:hypothetical protein